MPYPETLGHAADRAILWSRAGTARHLPPPIQAVPESAWANMKNGLGNLSAAGAGQLTAIIKNRLKSIPYRPALTGAFLAQTGLTLEPAPPLPAAGNAARFVPAR